MLDLPAKRQAARDALPSRTAPRFVGETPALATARRRRGAGLAARVLILTISFILLTQTMIYVARLAAYRENWLRDRLSAANTAALVFSAAPEGSLPPGMAAKILDSVGAKAIAITTLERRHLLAANDAEPAVSDIYDLRDPSLQEGVRAAFRSLFAPAGAALKVIGAAPMENATLEITLDQSPLADAMKRFSRTFLTISMTLSIVLALVLWMAIWLLVLRPVRRLTSNIMAFGERPGDVDRIIAPSRRRDEIGGAETALAAMQTSLAQELGQKKRLAELGMAVARINHDLRNMLAAAQLISDRLATIPDPLAMRLAPRLVATLDRAIAFCQSTLIYGGAMEKAPARRNFRLREVVEQAVETSGAALAGGIAVSIDIADDFEVHADADHILRAMENLSRNAVQIFAQMSPGSPRKAAIRVSAVHADGAALVEICDTGPGFPAGAAQRIFEPFHDSTRQGGSGLGLAIASDLIGKNGGSIVLCEQQRDDFYCGARFLITLPAPRRGPSAAFVPEQNSR